MEISHSEHPRVHHDQYQAISFLYFGKVCHHAPHLQHCMPVLQPSLGCLLQARHQRGQGQLWRIYTLSIHTSITPCTRLLLLLLLFAEALLVLSNRVAFLFYLLLLLLLLLLLVIAMAVRE